MHKTPIVRSHCFLFGTTFIPITSSIYSIKIVSTGMNAILFFRAFFHIASNMYNEYEVMRFGLAETDGRRAGVH